VKSKWRGLATESASGKYGRAQVAAAIIGYADLKLGERVAPVLEAMQAASPNRFRGVRHSVRLGSQPGAGEQGHPGRAWPATSTGPAPGCWRAGGCAWRIRCTIPSWQSWQS
jgi:hypothetical protein